jgi:hypothetical protein
MSHGWSDVEVVRFSHPSLQHSITPLFPSRGLNSAQGLGV